tara:strand:- start:51 stop:899 length:849 start_codon:yes stop_codon:yes gene_type:complete
MITSLIISLILTYLLCLLLDIRTRDIIVIATISTLVIIIFDKFFNMNQKVSSFIYNTKLPFLPNKNNFTVQKYRLKPSSTSYDKLIPHGYDKLIPHGYDKLIPTKKGELIPSNMYNQEDCTNDGSCIQKPDEQNLFPGFCGNPKITKQISNLNFKISKMENNINNMKNDEGIFIETFQNNRSPQELVDIIKPYNKTLITPYESKPKSKNNFNSHEMMETTGLCFNCKVGTCDGGVCKSVNQENVGGVKSYTKEQSKMALAAHPYSTDQPLIRMSNPGQIDFR